MTTTEAAPKVKKHCDGSGKRTHRGRYGSEYEPDRCPECKRLAYVRLDGTTGKHWA